MTKDGLNLGRCFVLTRKELLSLSKNENGEGKAPIHRFVSELYEEGGKSSIRLVTLMIDVAPDVVANVYNKSGLNLAHRAAKNGDNRTLQLLANYKATKKLLREKQHGDGKTPLDFANDELAFAKRWGRVNTKGDSGFTKEVRRRESTVVLLKHLTL